MKNIINQIKASGPKSVLIIGDIMLDEYFFGTVTRVSPEAPVPVLKEESRDWCLGGAANVAANCKHIGCDVSLVGVLNSTDEAGRKIVSMLRTQKISTEGVVLSSERPTTNKKRFLAKNHQMLRVDTESANHLSDQEFYSLIRSIDDRIKPSSIILISDYSKGVINKQIMAHVIAQARRFDCIVMVDPKGPDFSQYQGVDYLKPNAKEFAHMIEFFTIDKQLSFEQQGQELCKILNLKGLIVTLGERGIVYIDHQQTIMSPAHKREVYDLTGAGDTVFAFLALGFAHAIPLEDSLMLANFAASVAVSHLKTYAVSLDELIDNDLEPTEKIYTDWASLKIELDWLRSDGKRVIFTNGCFDILHPGHIHTLKEAKKHGDILVIALNTDASIRRLKGASRPVNDLAYRATMMAAIGLVDFVVSFEQDTPQQLIEYLKPDVLVKGGDYKKEDIVGYDTVTAYGGAVHIIDYVPGVSTTSFIEKVQASKQQAQ